MIACHGTERTRHSLERKLRSLSGQLRATGVVVVLEWPRRD
jgi:hypothetical protein